MKPLDTQTKAPPERGTQVPPRGRLAALTSTGGRFDLVVPPDIPGFLLAESLTVVNASRLVRAICPTCKTKVPPPAELHDELGGMGIDGLTNLWEGGGCKNCGFSGFKGRTGIYELFEMDQGLQSLILTNPTIDTLQKYLQKNGLGTLRDLGNDKVKERITTIEEVQRVTSVAA